MVKPRNEETTLLAIIWAGWFSIILSRFVIPPILPLIGADLNISSASSGLLMSTYLFPYALMQVPAGMVSDRIGPKRLIAVGIFGSSAATALSWFTHSFGQLLVLTTLAGTLGGLYFAPSTALIASRCSKRTGRALGIAFTGGSVARTTIYLLVGLLAPILQEWRPLYMMSSVPGLIVGPLALVLIEDKRSSRRQETFTDSDRSTAIPQLVEAVRSRVIIVIFLLNLLVSVAEWGLMTFTPSYLVDVKHASVSLASLVSLAAPLTGIFSAPVSGYLSDRFGFARPTLIAMVSMCMISVLLPISFEEYQLIPLFLAWGFLGGLWYTPLLALATNRTGTKVQGAFLGLYNSMYFLGGTVGPILLGLFVDLTGYQALYTSTLLIYAIGALLTVSISRSKSPMNF